MSAAPAKPIDQERKGSCVSAVGLFGLACMTTLPEMAHARTRGLDMSPAEWARRFCEPTRPR
ncbi:hypothetical protein ABC347_01630 [Sphingomonas sp. 1P06PA]|uniref:hypothetical protein n=1 Tax=Sphingomonas sp. 1P06PA TaxID=554121 RepID=UPI0039A56AFB